MGRAGSPPGMVEVSPLAWVGFFAMVAGILAVDLGYFHRRAHVASVREAGAFATLWIAIGMSFALVVWWLYSSQEGPAAGTEAAQLYVTGYLLEESLSVDNLFVFIVIFGYFGVGPAHQHRVLFYGILGAILMRGLFIFAGVAALEAFEAAIYILAGLLVFTAARMALAGESEIRPEESRLFRVFKRLLPVSPEPHEGKFFHHHPSGGRHATTLFLCLLMIEATDVLFALDSVPAVLGVTHDPFIVYTSNIFAIVGLRSLYFVVAAGLRGLKYLKPALVLLLAFIGGKMIVGGPDLPFLDMPGYTIPVSASLAIVASTLGLAILASIVSNRRHPAPAPSPAAAALGSGRAPGLESGRDP
jgi:tellurite resistance protein TerC